MPSNARRMERIRVIRPRHGAPERSMTAPPSTRKRRLINTPSGLKSKQHDAQAAADGRFGRAGRRETRAAGAGKKAELRNRMAISQVDKQFSTQLIVTNKSSQKGDNFFVYLLRESRGCSVSYLHKAGWPRQQGDKKSGKYGVAGLRGRAGRF